MKENKFDVGQTVYFFFSDLFWADPDNPKSWVVRCVVRKVKNHSNLPIHVSYEVMPEDREDSVVDLMRVTEDELYSCAADAYDSMIEKLNRDIEAQRRCLDHLLKRKDRLEEEKNGCTSCSV